MCQLRRFFQLLVFFLVVCSQAYAQSYYVTEEQMKILREESQNQRQQLKTLESQLMELREQKETLSNQLEEVNQSLMKSKDKELKNKIKDRIVTFSLGFSLGTILFMIFK